MLAERENPMVVPVERRTAQERHDLHIFARRLNTLLAERGMSASDLARAIWGSATDNRGRNVAKNRDRISHYANGRQMPEPKTVKMIADVLRVAPADLLPALSRPEGNVADEAIASMTVIAGTTPSMARIVVDRVVPTSVAARIMALVADSGVDTPA